MAIVSARTPEGQVTPFNSRAASYANLAMRDPWGSVVTLNGAAPVTFRPVDVRLEDGSQATLLIGGLG